ncbi:hypothetical protein [Marinigracilibium pacificum]|uniref:Uncharacterized protein n=1 Tax=Marinigracilibium pacificum TaxID=2729599 RepID=A0A848J9D6_9BACT|nr:hypothetical protein [Marinigracilibium pacificum]NMM49662.1 hypothetical protein [Marinigracilibium pacificum]
MKKPHLFLVLPILFCLSFSSKAQTINDQDSEHPIAVVAPHLPQLLRFEGTGNSFYGVERQYQSDNNINRLQAWITNFPEEYSSYKGKIEEYLASVDQEALSNSDLEIYYDIKSQWLMLSQLSN